MSKKTTGAEIRQDYIEFFVERGHTFVPSASLVPGGDATLLFTNAGMVQFKDVFLGIDKRPYTRAVDSQKVLRVAGKHNDLDEVGRDGSHHTFFEMLGNWSFGDYYKKEAIAWAWELLTEVWRLPKDKLYATCFQDDKGNIPTDEDAAEIWKQQDGFDPAHVQFFGRKENFWEMAEVGPCGPCSEIHIDRGEAFDELAGSEHRCGVNGECQRYLELWNNVFIQYNRTDPSTLEPLPATHVDTGMGFERIVSVIQGVDSNYKTDLFEGALTAIRTLTGHTVAEMMANFTPYRVIADHVRAAAFLIADGVVPGNIGRNYICRMIIRRAARFGTKIGLMDPFMGKVAEAFIATYGDFYPELKKNHETILDNITREEIRFARTVESGTAVLQRQLDALKESGGLTVDGGKAFDLYGTYGLPFEISRDIAREQDLDVDEQAFFEALEAHRKASGGGQAIGKMGGEDAEFYAEITKNLIDKGVLKYDGVEYNPYDWMRVTSPLLALVAEGRSLTEAGAGDPVEVMLEKTGFYIESGGQVSDKGIIRANDGTWEIEVTDLRKPSPGTIVHVGEVVFGHPKVGDLASGEVDEARRHDIQRNHTATHLLHAALQRVLGGSARQAGSAVTPGHLRFDFNHPEAMTPEQIDEVERLVNAAVLADYQVIPTQKTRDEAVAEGAMALFGEKYGDEVRTIRIGSTDHRHSYELCGGTHLERTSEVGVFLIVSESSVASNVRRIEAITGRGAYELIRKRFVTLKQAANTVKSALDDLPQKVAQIESELASAKKQVAAYRGELALSSFKNSLASHETINGIRLVVTDQSGADKDALGKLADHFREQFPQNGICVVSSFSGEQVLVMAVVTQDLIKRGIKAGDLVGHISRLMGSGGGGAPHLAFGGGKEIGKLGEAMAGVRAWVNEKSG